MSLLVPTKRNGRLFPAIIEDFFKDDDFLGSTPDFFRREFVPDANVIETEKDFQIELAAPGMDRKDFNVKVENDTIRISAEKKEEKEEKGKNFRRKEFSYNSFTRSFMLPSNVLADGIDAKYDQGILKLTIPKKEVSKLADTKNIKVS